MLSGDGERYVAVMQAFLDESGTNPETPILSVAGFYGTDSQWDAFMDLWKPVIKGKTFHALYSTELFPEICAAIEASRINGILCTVSKEIYRVHACDQLKSFVGNPYAICTFMCALQICEDVHQEPVSFVLEQGQPNLSFVKMILESMIDDDESCVAAVASAKKADFIQLHTADFVSHIASSQDEPWMQRLFDADRLKHARITEKLLVDMSPKMKALVGRARQARRQAKKTR